jgi:hypothetical protein
MRDSDPGGNGVRFRLFPQTPYRTATPHEPETVRLSPPAGTIGPGPQDDRMYVVAPIGKREPYGISFTAYGTPYLHLPPWDGTIRPPALPGPDGHFDHLEVGTHAFEQAHVYGVVRFVLDIWQGYLGRDVEWHFARDHERLEISLFPGLDNARAGWGFMEVGSHFTERGEPRPFSLNFDVLAHELGHLIIYAEVGLPADDAIEGEYFGFHESAADLVALIAALHFDSVVDDLLAMTSGNLYTFNELNRFAELSENDEIRNASNGRKLSEFAHGWSDEHDLSEPLTGAIFDVFVDVFHEMLVDRGLISPEVEDLFDQLEGSPECAVLIQDLFDQAFPRDPQRFKEALRKAGDYLGLALARAWQRLSPHFLNYVDVGDALLEVDRELSGGRYQQAILNNFRWREIGIVSIGSRLSVPGAESHVFSTRTLTPEHKLPITRLSFRERWARAGTPVTRSMQPIGGDYHG